MSEKGEWHLSPAYDMTFIFNTGGFLPETDHCLSVKGKLSNISLVDVLNFASDNGIRQPKKIIREVAEAVKQFPVFAAKNNVKQEWINRVLTALNHSLQLWGLTEPARDLSVNHEGHMIEHIKIAETQSGNYHLYAVVDGAERKSVIRKKTELHTWLTQKGPNTLTDDELRQLAIERLISK